MINIGDVYLVRELMPAPYLNRNSPNQITVIKILNKLIYYEYDGYNSDTTFVKDDNEMLVHITEGKLTLLTKLVQEDKSIRISYNRLSFLK
jgi:hypothetical protein